MVNIEMAVVEIIWNWNGTSTSLTGDVFAAQALVASGCILS